MIQKNIKIQIPTGLEARPVAVLVQIASKDETLEKGRGRSGKWQEKVFAECKDGL